MKNLVIDPNNSISKKYRIYHTNRKCRFYSKGLKKKVENSILCRYCFLKENRK